MSAQDAKTILAEDVPQFSKAAAGTLVPAGRGAGGSTEQPLANNQDEVTRAYRVAAAMLNIDPDNTAAIKDACACFLTVAQS